jgi:hypothetical protein
VRCSRHDDGAGAGVRARRHHDYALYHKLRLARFDGTGWVLFGDAVSERD